MINQSIRLKTGVIAVGELIFKKELYGIILMLNQLLTDNINIHEAIFNPPKRAAIPIPFIFKKINFEELYKSGNAIQEQIEQCFENLKSIKGTELDQTLSEGIREYLICFMASVSKLTEIAYELYLKSRSQNKLSLSEYKRLIDEYQENEQQRLERSEMMNKIVSILQRV
jgi:hypothetical protein